MNDDQLSRIRQIDSKVCDALKHIPEETGQSSQSVFAGPVALALKILRLDKFYGAGLDDVTAARVNFFGESGVLYARYVKRRASWFESKEAIPRLIDGAMGAEDFTLEELRSLYKNSEIFGPI